jgi:hypothetical protein
VKPQWLGAIVVPAIAISAFAYQCQAPREMRTAVENLNFAQGASDAPPPGWYLGPEWFMPPHEPIYEARIAPRESCNGSKQCAALRSLRQDPSVRLSFLYQLIDATQFRGQRLTFRADVRAQVTNLSAARLLVRVHRIDCSTSFRDDMGNRPIILATWAPYEIQAPISSDARDIEFGVQLIGQGAAWIDNISLTFAGR